MEEISYDDWMIMIKEINHELNKGKPTLMDLINRQAESSKKGNEKCC